MRCGNYGRRTFESTLHMRREGFLKAVTNMKSLNISKNTLIVCRDPVARASCWRGVPMVQQVCIKNPERSLNIVLRMQLMEEVNVGAFTEYSPYNDRIGIVSF